MLDLNKFGEAEEVKKRQCMIKHWMRCVGFMMLFVLMLRKDPIRRNRSKYHVMVLCQFKFAKFFLSVIGL